MGIFVGIPLTLFACWIAVKLYDCTERDSIKLIILCAAIATAGLLTAIISKLLGLGFYGSEFDEIDQRGTGPFRW